MVCIATNGDVSLAINKGDGSGTKPPTFTNLGLVKTNEGYPRERVRMVDIDGDGRGELDRTYLYSMDNH